MENDHTQTRQQRRHAERGAPRKRPVRILDRAELLRLAASLVEADQTVSGVSIITPQNDEVEHIDARIFRREGGWA